MEIRYRYRKRDDSQQYQFVNGDDTFSLSFFIAVNTSQEMILKILKEHKGISMSLSGYNQVIINRNHVEIIRNEDYDEKLSLIDADAFLYYESNVYFYPCDEILTLEEQIWLAKEICRIFSESGISSEIVAEFEKLL